MSEVTWQQDLDGWMDTELEKLGKGKGSGMEERKHKGRGGTISLRQRKVRVE